MLLTGRFEYDFDAFLKLQLGPPHLYGFLEGEGYIIRGSTWAIPLGGHPEETWCQDHGYARCPDWLYTKKDVKLAAYLGRMGVFWKALPKIWLKVKLETGFASGEDDFLDDTFTSMPAHSDLKVGLVLYDMLLYEITRQSWVDNPGLWSGGGLYNSYYGLVMAKLTMMDKFDFLVQGLFAWSHKSDGAIIMLPPVKRELQISTNTASRSTMDPSISRRTGVDLRRTSSCSTPIR